MGRAAPYMAYHDRPGNSLDTILIETRYHTYNGETFLPRRKRNLQVL